MLVLESVIAATRSQIRAGSMPVVLVCATSVVTVPEEIAATQPMRGERSCATGMDVCGGRVVVGGAARV